MAPDDEIVLNLKRDLQDGEDLARAVRLVSDAVERRIRRIQRSLDLMEDETAPVIQARLEVLVDRYRDSLSTQSDALERIIEKYQPELADLAEALDESVDG